MFDAGFELDFTSGIRDFFLPSPRLYLKSKKKTSFSSNEIWRSCDEFILKSESGGGWWWCRNRQENVF